MMHSMRILFSILLVIILLAFPIEARADIAPPINPPGSNVQPGEESTQVRMVNEKIVLDVYDDGQEPVDFHARRPLRADPRPPDALPAATPFIPRRRGSHPRACANRRAGKGSGCRPWDRRARRIA